MEQFFASCPRGLESVLAEELASLGARQISPAEGGVGFAGELETAYRANLWSRVASRILWKVTSGRYRGEDDLYRAIRAIEWRDYFHVSRTIRVNVSAVQSPLKSLEFVALRTKDAVCDRFRDTDGRRPSVDTARPDVRLHVFLTAADYTVYLDTSGEALFKRGYRRDGGEAPLRENLAAGILLLSGWKPDQALLDPMCGSGTFLIEAAHIALGIAPGIRREFGFQKLESFDAKLWRQVRERSGSPAVASPLIFGSDVNRSSVESARRNVREAEVEHEITLAQGDVLSIAPPAPAGVLVANPAYGVRLDDQERIARFYPTLGDALKQHFAGWRACIFTADLRLPKLIGLKPAKRTPLYNGALECRLYVFELVRGTMRREKDRGSKAEGRE
jgi:putative N6-adenine-specific DNA methylase